MSVPVFCISVIALTWFMALSVPKADAALRPTGKEMNQAHRWASSYFGVRPHPLPFTFTYGGDASADLLRKWKSSRTVSKIDDTRTRIETTWTDPATGLQVVCDAVTYSDFPTVEWTIHFKNTGATDTPIIEKILPLDIDWRRLGVTEYLLHHNVGSPANRSDYGPLETPLGPGAKQRISAAGGRPTNSDMSYFNLGWGDSGAIVVVGWPGQWSADFARNSGDGIHISAGQELTHFKLHPGEEARTPLIVLQSWQGDWIRGQNIWRRWMLAHNVPRPGGKLPPPQLVASSSRAYEEMKGATEANQIMHIDRYVEEGIKLSYWWMDAGWYVQQHGWPQVGTWEVDTKRFPHGFKAISDHAHARGVKILVWFEPERVAEDTWLSNNHPEWILGGKGGGLLNLGNPDAWHWLVEHIDRLITENGIDLYRQDFNMDPLSFWRNNDAPDRQGMTEIKHVTGFLAYWDELRRRHPNMLIDSCASGGRRNDLETMRRAVPLWRSDYAYEPIGHQGMTYGISMWIPFHGTGTVMSAAAPYYGGGVTAVEPYAFWSNVSPSLGVGMDIREKGLDYELIRKLIAEWRELNQFYFSDYYPLTPYTQAEDAWIAWQFDRPESGDGAVQAFRRQKSETATMNLKLRGLDAHTRYEVREAGGTRLGVYDGSVLMGAGLAVTIEAKPGAAVLFYRRAR
jgi:alpha-galactosidase